MKLHIVARWMNAILIEFSLNFSHWVMDWGATPFYPLPLIECINAKTQVPIRKDKDVVFQAIAF